MSRSPATPDDDFRPREHPVEDDIAFQRKVWKIERVGWVGLLALLVLTLLGLFSDGPLSNTLATTADGALQVEYSRFLRKGARDSLRISIQGEPQASLQVSLEAPFLHDHNIEIIQPLPPLSRSEEGGMHLTVPADRSGKASLHFTVRAERAGPTRLGVRFGGHHLTLWQFIYP